MTPGWCVRISVFDDIVVSISERELCGRDLSEADKDLIRDCAQHLLSFVGEKKPAPRPDGRCPGYRRSDYGKAPTCKYCGVPENEHVKPKS